MHRCLLLFACTTLLAQGVEGPKFEVASVKRIGPTSPRIGPGPASPSRYSFTAVPVAFLSQAFDKPSFLFANVDTRPNDFYEITATLPEGSTKQDVPVMLRNLLIERFNLRYHREVREVTRFEVRVAETGHKMKDVTNAPAVDLPEQMISIKPGADGYVEFIPGRNMGPVGFKGRWGMQRVRITMVEFARELERLLDGAVVDLTGLTGKYDFTLKWSTSLTPPNDANAAEFSDPPLLVALREQLGLSVRRGTGPAEVIVIDNMTREPTPN